jgi:hypothetical protein
VTGSQIVEYEMAAVTEAKRIGADIDVPRLKAGLRELSDAFVKGRQGSHGMRIPAEPYRDGDLVCGGAFRLIERLETELVQAEAAVRSLLEVTEHGSNRGPVFDARVEAYAFIRRAKQ